MSRPTEIEAKSLPAHVAACAERYDTLFRAIRRVERIMLTGGAALILTLLSVLGWTVTKLWGYAQLAAAPFALLVGTALLLLAPVAAARSAGHCKAPAALARQLADDYGERRLGGGASSMFRNGLEFYVSPAGTWTVVKVSFAGTESAVACIVDAGTGWDGPRPRPAPERPA